MYILSRWNVSSGNNFWFFLQGGKCPLALPAGAHAQQWWCKTVERQQSADIYASFHQNVIMSAYVCIHMKMYNKSEILLNVHENVP